MYLEIAADDPDFPELEGFSGYELFVHCKLEVVSKTDEKKYNFANSKRPLRAIAITVVVPTTACVASHCPVSSVHAVDAKLATGPQLAFALSFFFFLFLCVFFFRYGLRTPFLAVAHILMGLGIFAFVCVCLCCLFLFV